MTIDEWWPSLRPETQARLIANNGDVVPEAVMSEIEAVGGPGMADPWWSDHSGPAGRCMPDSAVDWIEATANDETPAR